MVATDSATRDSDPSAEPVTRALNLWLERSGQSYFVFGSALCAFGSALPGLGQNITPAPRISRRPEKGYD